MHTCFKRQFKSSKSSRELSQTSSLSIAVTPTTIGNGCHISFQQAFATTSLIACFALSPHCFDSFACFARLLFVFVTDSSCMLRFLCLFRSFALCFHCRLFLHASLLLTVSLFLQFLLLWANFTVVVCLTLDASPALDALCAYCNYPAYCTLLRVLLPHEND